MKKNKKNIFLLLVIIIFTIVLYNRTIDAQTVDPLPSIGNISLRPLSSLSASRVSIFGGKIISLKESTLLSYESAGYTCEVPGKTIEIRTAKGTLGYFIPEGLTPRTKHELNIGQSIIGKEQGTETINCKKCEKENQSDFLGIDLGIRKDKENCIEANFNLPKIIDPFGTSRI
jgi:hypothetical protein